MKPNFENYFVEHAPLLGEVLYYHLTLEALLTELIRRAPNAPAASKLQKMMFAKKADTCLQMGKLSADLHAAVVALNRVRNKYAHELGYEISFESALALANLCGKAGAEFTDGVDGCTEAQAKELGYDTATLLNETFRNTFFEVAYRHENDGWMDFIG